MGRGEQSRQGVEGSTAATWPRAERVSPTRCDSTRLGSAWMLRVGTPRLNAFESSFEEADVRDQVGRHSRWPAAPVVV